MAFNCIILYSTQSYHKIAGPYRLATNLRKFGFSCLCLDISELSFEELINILDKHVSESTQWIGFSTSFMTDILGVKIYTTLDDIEDYQKINIFVQHFKNKNSKIKFLQGGYKFFPLEKLDFYTFKGSSDATLVEFTRWCVDSNYKPNLIRLGKLIDSGEYSDFTTSTIDWEDQDCILPGEYLPIEVSRGCIFRCKFCAYPYNGKVKGEWVKHAEVLIQEFERNYALYGVTDYYFVDDTYNDSFDKINYFYKDVFSKLSFKINWSAYIRLDLLMRFPESLDILRESGLVSATFGIETLRVENAKAIGKGVNPMQQIEFISSIKNKAWKNINVSSGFIFGLPYDTEKSLVKDYEFLMSEDNPLDAWRGAQLFITPAVISQRYAFHSEFDKNYNEYGYQVGLSKGTKNLSKWTNLNTGLNSTFCAELADRSKKDLLNNNSTRLCGDSLLQFKSLGISIEDLRTKSPKQLFNENNFLLSARQDRYKSYINKISKL